ncbi:MAG: DMT family transporter [Clostridia bacterium]|nr:DMT family transporter [Clostridia bacterium]
MKSTSVATKNKHLAYLGLVFVILIWGISPLITLRFYKYYSPTIRISFGALTSAIALLIISRRKLNLLNKTYFIIAVPTGFFMSLANIIQKIGLQYTTPTHYAFLENLSVIVVPILLIFFLKKKPSFLTIFSAILCLFSSFILTGMTTVTNGVSVVGDLLCALAGIFYGVNIAGTGAFAKKLHTPLYLTIQMFTEVIVSFVGVIIFDVTEIEKIVFDFDWRLILANIVIVFISSTICWLIRTNAMKVVDATVVAIMMPFSSVVTAIVSTLTGNDTLTVNLIVGVTLGLIAIILSGLGDHKSKISY